MVFNLLYKKFVTLLFSFILIGSLSSCSLYGGNEGKKYYIGVISPTTGKQGDQGNAILDGVKIALDEFNKKNRTNIQVLHEDDQGNPTVAQEAATRMENNNSVLGIIGTLNSSTALAILPDLNSKSLAMVSPANTANALTMGNKWDTAPSRAYNNFYRIVANNKDESQYAANYMKNVLGTNSIAVVNDSGTYGFDLANGVTDQFKSIGGNIATSLTINPNESDYSSVVNKINASNVNAVFYGGQYNEAALLSDQLKSKGFKGYLFGGDAVYDDNYISINKSHSEGDYSISVVVDGSSTHELQDFQESYKKATNSPIGAYAYTSYDSGNILASAINKVTKSKSSNMRADVIKALNSTNYSGITGHIMFDKYGDIQSPVINLYKVEGNKWVHIK